MSVISNQIVPYFVTFLPEIPQFETCSYYVQFTLARLAVAYIPRAKIITKLMRHKRDNIIEIIEEVCKKFVFDIIEIT